MSNIEQILKDAWETVKGFDNGSIQLGIEHILNWFVTYETPTNKALIVISHYPIDRIEPSKCINTTCRKRHDGTYYISFQLTEKTQEDIFIVMCSNIIRYSSSALSEKDATIRIASRYNQWRKLMEHRNLAILSDEKRRGLIGELLYLKEIIRSGKPLPDALSGWVGPDGADQDFVYDGCWREIKTTGLSSDKITIHSLEQLGLESNNGLLFIYRVDSCAPEQDGAFTLRGLVASITNLLNENYELVEQFTTKLNSVGYIDLEVYDSFPYKFFNFAQYDVNDDFPRIIRKDVRPEILNCEYDISISSIDKWRK